VVLIFIISLKINNFSPIIIAPLGINLEKMRIFSRLIPNEMMMMKSA
jgi:hypothetical protein